MYITLSELFHLISEPRCASVWLQIAVEYLRYGRIKSCACALGILARRINPWWRYGR